MCGFVDVWMCGCVDGGVDVWMFGIVSISVDVERVRPKREVKALSYRSYGLGWQLNYRIIITSHNS